MGVFFFFLFSFSVQGVRGAAVGGGIGGGATVGGGIGGGAPYKKNGGNFFLQLSRGPEGPSR